MVMTIPRSHSISSYPNFPSLSEWKSDSSVGSRFSPRRKNDHVLAHIDGLVAAVNNAKSSGEAQYLMGDIYFATMFWNNNHTRDPKMDARRRPTIMRLQLTSANLLSQAFGCGIGGLAAKLQEIYGTAMGPHGVNVDAGNSQNYLDAARQEAFRVTFKGGQAWRFNCLEYKSKPNLKEPLRLLDTKEYAEFMSKSVQDMDTRIADEYKAGYVMSMSREFYVGPFMANKMWINKFPKFHSYFVGGRAVQCAGIIRFKKGLVDYIDNESGHYKPIDLALVKALEQLQTVGMKLSKITVAATIERDRPWKPVERTKFESYRKLGVPTRKQHEKMEKLLKAKERTHTTCKGDKFLAANGNWESIIASGM